MLGRLDRHARRVEALGAAGDLLHAARGRSRAKSGAAAGVVVATDYLTGELAARSRRMTQAFENYNQLRVLKRPLTGVYLSFFLMVTLMILVGATWMGLYLAKRITRPVQMLAAAAREIGAGHLDQRVEPQSDDEFGSLIEAFNTMAGELAASRRQLERSTVELERKHLEVEGRRRYIETILERITTGVVSIDAAGAITTINSAAARLLEPRSPASSASRRARCSIAPDLQPLGALLDRAVAAAGRRPRRRSRFTRDGQELHLAVVATALTGDDGGREGAVLVLDDVTPLIRAQKVAAWREVARRLAHEIKNPLTPIQLSAERLRRHFARRRRPAQALVDECTATIVGEVESLKGLVDEFSQFARMPAPRDGADRPARSSWTTRRALRRALRRASCSSAGSAPDVPLVRLDPEQIRRVIINLVDNAIEAMERQGGIVDRDAARRGQQHRRGSSSPTTARAFRRRAREAVPAVLLDEAAGQRPRPGDRPADHRRARRQHRRWRDNVPRGTRFTIELPC